MTATSPMIKSATDGEKENREFMQLDPKNLFILGIKYVLPYQGLIFREIRDKNWEIG